MGPWRQLGRRRKDCEMQKAGWKKTGSGLQEVDSLEPPAHGSPAGSLALALGDTAQVSKHQSHKKAVSSHSIHVVEVPTLSYTQHTAKLEHTRGPARPHPTYSQLSGTCHTVSCLDTEHTLNDNYISMAPDHSCLRPLGTTGEVLSGHLLPSHTCAGLDFAPLA